MIIDDFFEENFLKEILNEFPKNHEFMNFKKQWLIEDFYLMIILIFIIT